MDAVRKVFREDGSRIGNIAELINTITNDNNVSSEITYEQADKAYQVVTILFNSIKNKSDALYFFSSMNLMNAYVKKANADEYLKKNYRFKTYVAKAIEQIVNSNINDVSIYIDKDITYISIDGLQFSFHNVRLSKALEGYIKSPKNKKQTWTGIRLQPVAGLIFDWVDENRKNNKRELIKSY